ncbi:MAG: DNA helicase, partial [Chloroflexota bacterium]
IEALSYIPHRGQGSLPFAAPDHNPNLVRVYIDAQHDYLEDRIYLLGALVVGCVAGEPCPERRRSIVHLADGPPDAAREEALFVAWTRGLIRAIHDLAAPDPEGLPRAPIHLIFFNHFEQRQLLAGLSRHFTRVTRAAPLYEFLTQLAAFDSPIATFLDEEIREQKNYPMVCQSLQIVAASLGFVWDTNEPFRQIFRTRLFDFWRKGEEAGPEGKWYLGRARYSSQIPLEYAYSVWGELSPPAHGARDLFAPYRQATAPLLRAFHGRRLEAIEHIARDFHGNHLTEKRSFDLPDLAGFSDRAHGLAAALDEFVTIERLVELAAWKRIRQAAPEQRVLSGETLIGRYLAADQEPGVALLNAENRRRYDLREERKAATAANEDPPSKERDKETVWKQDGLRIRLRCEPGPDCSPESAMALTTLRAGDGVVVFPRWTVDSRLPVEARIQNVPTPKQMLYGSRATIRAIREERGDEGRVTAVWLELEMRSGFGGGARMRGFVFGAMDRPFEEDTLYTIDSDPNDWYGYWGSHVTSGLCAGGANTLYERLVDP